MRHRASVLPADQAMRVLFDISDGLELWLDDRRLGMRPGDRGIEVRLTGEGVPTDLIAVHVRGQIGSERISETYEPEPNLVFEHVWDGTAPKDGLWAAPASSLLTEVEVGWEMAPRFPRSSRIRWWKHNITCGGVDLRSMGCGGITPSAVHRLDVAADILWRGTGSRLFDAQANRSRAVDRLAKSRNELIVSDGPLAHIFDRDGNFKRTLSAIKGTVVTTARTDDEGRINSWVHGGRRYTIDRRTSCEALFRSQAGVWAVVDFDGDGRAVAVTDQTGSKVTLEWADRGGISGITDSAGRVTKIERDDVGRVVRFVDSDGHQIDLARTELESGTEIKATTGEGRTTRYRMERLTDGTVVETRSRDGVANPRIIERRSLGPLGQETVVHRPDKTVATTRRGRQVEAGTAVEVARTSVTGPTGRTMSVERRVGHERTGRTNAQITIGGSTWTRLLDPETGSMSSVSPEQRKSLAVVEPGETLTTSTPHSSTRVVSYDDEQRPRKMAHHGSEVMYGYDQNGRLTWTDFERWRQQLHHDDQGRLVSIETPDGWLRFTRDDAGSVSAVSNAAGAITHIERLADGRIVGIDYPDAEEGQIAEHFVYDTDGLLVRRCFDDGHEVSYLRDKVGRVERVIAPGLEIHARYDDATGQLSELSTDDGNEVQYLHDGEAVFAEVASGQTAGSIERRFDENNQIKARSVNRGRALPYERDRDGLITSIGPLRLTRDACGAVIKLQLDGLTTTRSYDGEGRLSSQETRFGENDTLYFAERIERDSLGRVIEVAEHTHGVEKVVTYDYNDQRRLAEVEIDDEKVLAIAYDASGNITELTRPDRTLSLHYDQADRLTAVAGIPTTHDAAGNLIGIGQGGVVRSYRYDGLGRAVGFTDARGVEIDQVLDPLGRPVEVRASGSLPLRMLWDGSRPAATLDDRDLLDLQFIDTGGGAAPEALIRDSQLYLIVADHTGSVRCVVNAHNGDIAQAIDYDALGHRTLDTAPGWQPFGFAGGLQEPNSGLVRFKTRTYDPFLGRFLGRDPEGFAGGSINQYEYGHGDPINCDDPRRAPDRPVESLALRRDTVVGGRPLTLDWIYLKTNEWRNDLALGESLGLLGRLLVEWDTKSRNDDLSTKWAAAEADYLDADAPAETFGVHAPPRRDGVDWSNRNQAYDASWTTGDPRTGAAEWEHDESSWSNDPGLWENVRDVAKLANPFTLIPGIASSVSRIADSIQD